MQSPRVTTIAINCGGAAVDGLAADQPYVRGSWGYDKGLPWHVDDSEFSRSQFTIENHYGYPNAFKTFRFHDGAPLHYKFDLPNGYYEVRLYFAEPWHKRPGTRIFDVWVNERTFLRRFDIAKEAGGSRRGIERVFTGIPVTSRQLDLEFVTVEHDPIVSIIRVTREGEEVPPPPPAPARHPASAEGLERVDDRDLALISYFGTWASPTDLAGDSNGGGHRSNVPGSAADFHFKGSHVTWIGARDGDHGVAEVSVDGILQVTVDTYSPHRQPRQVLFEQSGLGSERYHTIRVRATRVSSNALLANPSLNTADPR